MRKNLKIILLLLTIMTAAWLFTGCGDRGQADTVSQTEEISRTEQPANTESDEEQNPDATEGQKPDVAEEQNPDTAENQPTDDNAPTDESIGDSADAPASNMTDPSAGESTELCVFVESIGDNSVVGNKISMEPDIDGDNIVVMVGEGGDNKKLVSIYFVDDASYVYQIIRNGDVETREGSFSDIKINMILDLTGYYKGEDFYADKVAISDVRK